MNESDLELLRRYGRDRAEDAFAEIVRRHLGLVHSAALRQVRSPELAEEVAQSVFTDLARSARRLAPDTILAAWLYQVARRTAIDVVRREARRQVREQIASEMNAMNATDADWTHIEPLLDEAMDALDETDRAAVLLRYFENKSLREVGQTLGTSEDAAQKRVSRAVEQLRELFSKRGVTVGTSGLVVLLSANAVQATPLGLAGTISTTAALAGKTLAAATGAIKTIAMTTLQKTLITATLTVVAGVAIYEARQNVKLHGENEAQQEQIARMKLESENLPKTPVVVADAKSPADEHLTELLRLRGEVGVLRRQKTELENSLANARSPRPRGSTPGTEQPPASPLPDDYPKTADGAAKGIFETFARGDWDAFYARFDVDGGRELFEKAINEETKSNLVGMEIVSVGTPTNSFGPNMWFVPYTIRLKGGDEKTLRLHVAQDSKTQRWILKGGF